MGVSFAPRFCGVFRIWIGRSDVGLEDGQGQAGRMASVNIDGAQYELKDGDNLLQAVLSESLDLPYFCWHPAMGSVGSCRLCAVIEYADENDQRGRLQMACMMPVRDGMRVSLQAPFASDFRKQVIEWLMENHPHDCPVCEEGGECHLQDMTVMTGHSMRRYRGAKRTWRNQYLGPFIGHEMNRCITCYRCVRYYRDYAGGTDLDAFGSRARMFFGREEDGVLESEFAGNLVEVCPTGVFTDKPFSKHYTRKWDLQSAPSVCPGCVVGCNTFPAERYGVLKRVHNRYHGEVNGYFLCDRGRYGSHFVNSERRIRQPGLHDVEAGVFDAVDGETAVAELATRLGGGDLIGIGSPRASLEANFALKQLVGEQNFCTGLADDEAAALTAALKVYQEGNVAAPTIKEIEAADAVLVLGEDISNTAARLALAVRQAGRAVTFDMANDAGIPDWQDAGVRGHGQHARSPIFIATVAPTRIDDIAAATCRAAPQNIARAGFAIAHAIDASFAAGEDSDFVQEAAKALAGAKRPVIISGTEARDSAMVQAAANIAWALKGQGADTKLALVASEANSYGAAMLGGGLSLAAALESMQGGTGTIVLENDLYRRAAAEDIDASGAIVLDVLETPTAERASAVLPAASYAEQTGTFVNYEGRGQRFYQVFQPEDEVAPSWRWLGRLAKALGREGAAWDDFNALAAACASGALAPLAEVAPPPDYRVEGATKIPRQPHRYSGRTAMRADVNIHEPKTTVDEETPFSWSMEGQNLGQQDGATVPYVWTPGWNSNQSVFKFQQEVNGALAGGDPGVRLLSPKDSADALAERFREPPATATANGTLVAARVTHVFGGDELSAASPPIQERMPTAHAVLNPSDARQLGLSAGDGAKVSGWDASVAVRIDAEVPEGVVALAQGLPDTPPLTADTATLERDPDYKPPRTSEADVIARG